MSKIRWTCLKDNPELITKISNIKSRLDEVIEKDTDRHLADVGCILSFISKDLSELSEEAFELHEEQKIVK